MYKKLINKHLKARITEEQIPGMFATKDAQKKSSEQNKAALEDVVKRMKDYEDSLAQEDADSIDPPKRNLDSKEGEYHDDYEISNGMEQLRYDGVVSDSFKDRAEKGIAGDSTMGNDSDWANVYPEQQGFTGPEFGKKLAKKIKRAAQKRAKAVQAIYQFGDDIELAAGDSKIAKRNVALESKKGKKIIKEEVEYETKTITGSVNLHKDNTHFAIHKPTNSIVFTWDYSDVDNEELKDNKDDYFIQDIIDTVEASVDKVKKSDYIILTKKGLEKRGIDLNNYEVFVGQKYDDVKESKEKIKENEPHEEPFFKTINKEFGLPKGGDIRDENGQVYIYYYGPNEKASKWANSIKEKYGNKIVYINTANIKLKNKQNNMNDSDKSARDMFFKNIGTKDKIKQDRIANFRKELEKQGHDISNLSDEDILDIRYEVMNEFPNLDQYDDMSDISTKFESKKRFKSTLKENDEEKDFEYYMEKDSVDAEFVQWLSKEFDLNPATIWGVADVVGDPSDVYNTLDNEVNLKGYGFDQIYDENYQVKKGNNKNKRQIKKNKMKRLKFKKNFNGRKNALKLIPEHYKIDNKIFEMTDGVESYKIRWEQDTPVILESRNQNKITEDINKMMHLIGYNSRDTFGNLKGKERISENSKMRNFMDKTKNIISEDKEGNKVLNLIKEHDNETMTMGQTKVSKDAKESDPGEEETGGLKAKGDAYEYIENKKGKALSKDKAKEIAPESGIRENEEDYEQASREVEYGIHGEKDIDYDEDNGEDYNMGDDRIKTSSLIDNYGNDAQKIINDIKYIKNDDGKSPEIFIKSGEIMVSGEDGEYFADYYGEISGNGLPYIDDELEEIAKKYKTYWEWDNPGAIQLVPIYE